MPKSKKSWVQSQHPPTQWGGAADEAVLNNLDKKNNIKNRA
jgi:hypothetical protein